MRRSAACEQRVQPSRPGNYRHPLNIYQTQIQIRDANQLRFAL